MLVRYTIDLRKLGADTRIRTETISLEGCHAAVKHHARVIFGGR